MGLTITEALAEIKTVNKRIVSKRDYVSGYIIRMDGLKDPLAKEDGGSAGVIEREFQAINDLEKRIIDLRMGVQRANDNTQVTVEGKTMSISEWLVWRREVAPNRKRYLQNLKQNLHFSRQDAQRKGYGVFTQVNQGQAEKPTDFIINVDEAKIAAEVEQIENILGQLDGQLSLKNATVTID